MSLIIEIQPKIEFEEPCKEGYTVYTKSYCLFCDKVKELLKNHHIEFKTILCDSYLEESKGSFLAFIQHITGKEYKTFPIVFFQSRFIGGFSDLESRLNKDDAFVDLEAGIK
jgi:glutaredoxin